MSRAMLDRPAGAAQDLWFAVRPAAPGRMLGNDDRNSETLADRRGDPAIGISEMGMNQVEPEIASQSFNLPFDAGEQPIAFQSTEPTAWRRECAGVKDVRRPGASAVRN